MNVTSDEDVVVVSEVVLLLRGRLELGCLLGVSSPGRRTPGRTVKLVPTLIGVACVNIGGRWNV